jgi:hypothetical protein
MIKCANYSAHNRMSHMPCTSLVDVHVICLNQWRARKRLDRRRVAPHMRLEGAKMAELHYLEMGWSGSGWMDPLPMESTRSPTPASTTSYGGFDEPTPSKPEKARPRRKAAKKSSKKAARKGGRSAKRAARKSARKGRRTARKAGRATKRAARKSARKGRRAARKGGRSAKRSARKSARKARKSARRS